MQIDPWAWGYRWVIQAGKRQTIIMGFVFKAEKGRATISEKQTETNVLESSKILMIFEGNMRFKDKRVDSMLFSRGLIPTDFFYSPIAVWLWNIVLFLGIGFWIVIPIAFSGFFPLVMVYFGVSYLMAAYSNNSFALSKDSLMVVNPNFPFRKVTVYSLQEIEKVVIDEEKRIWGWVFGMAVINFISIEAGGKALKYHCAGLDLDAFDENMTEETMDTFQYELKARGVRTVFNLDTE